MVVWVGSFPVSEGCARKSLKTTTLNKCLEINLREADLY